MDHDPTNVCKGEPGQSYAEGGKKATSNVSVAKPTDDFPRLIKLSEDELKAIDRASIKVTDSSRYLETLGVFHQLHCL